MNSAFQDIVVAYYLPDEWQRWRELCADGHDFFAGTHADWLVRLDASVAELKAEGIPVKLVTIRVSEFLSWAAVNRKATDSAARAEFVGLAGSGEVPSGSLQ